MRPREEVLRYLSTVEQATLKEIYSNTSLYYYHGAMRHTGNILSNLVNSKMVVRVKNGVFRLRDESDSISNYNDLPMFI